MATHGKIMVSNSLLFFFDPVTGTSSNDFCTGVSSVLVTANTLEPLDPGVVEANVQETNRRRILRLAFAKEIPTSHDCQSTLITMESQTSLEFIVDGYLIIQK